MHIQQNLHYRLFISWKHDIILYETVKRIVLGSSHFSGDVVHSKCVKAFEPRHAIMCPREINYVMRYDVVKPDVIISRRA